MSLRFLLPNLNKEQYISQQKKNSLTSKQNLCNRFLYEVELNQSVV